MIFACLYYCACQMTTSTMHLIDWKKTIVVSDGGMGDGSSWGNATSDLQTAITGAPSQGKTHVLIVEGTYTLSGSIDHFELRNGVTVMGGFAGDERYLDPQGGETILSGGGSNYHVFYHPDGLNLDRTAILQNVTITGGRATGSNPHDRGAGMYNDNNSPTLIDCIFIDNQASGDGGGMCNLYNSNPRLINCTFEDNTSGATGGGVYNGTIETSPYIPSNPIFENCNFINNIAGRGGGMSNWINGENVTLINCSFVKNEATDTAVDVARGGGGIYNGGSSPTLISCKFLENTSARYGAGMYNLSRTTSVVIRSYSKLTNCIFIDNRANLDGGGICNYDSDPQIRSCTFTGNTAAQNGGGICNNDYGTSGSFVTFYGTTRFSSNEALTGFGGAIYSATNSSISGATPVYGAGNSPENIYPP